MSKSSSTNQIQSVQPRALLKKLGLKATNPGVFCGEWLGSGKVLKSISPIDGKVLGQRPHGHAGPEYERAVQRASEAFRKWQRVPAPKRGEIIRQLGNALRDAKQRPRAGSSRWKPGKFLRKAKAKCRR